jgi:arylsulfatase A-like enzyme
MRLQRLFLASIQVCVLLVLASSIQAQQVTGTPGTPGATTTIDGKQLPPPDPKFGGVIKEKASESTPWWPPRVVPPKGAPNVLLIMTDDCGFGAPGTFGGVIPTPAMDRIAKSGLRYTNFHSTSLCSPTRAALITGRNHHSVGFGVVGEIVTGFPGYDSIIPIEKGTIGTILKENGYATSWFGKNHNTPGYQSSQAGPFNQWPNGMGFEYFWGFVGGDASQWQPNLYRNTTAIYPFLNNPSWNMETAMANEAIQYMKQLKELAPEKPFFVYYVPGATHAPHHPTPEWIKKISDMHLFDGGWNKVRETIFANQKRLGIMPENAKLTDWPKDLPTWDSLSWDEKKLFIKQADIYGAYLAYADNEIGRVIQAVEDMGELDNTLIIYIGGDNGASAEGMLNGTPNEFTTFNGIPVPVKDQFLWYPFWGSDRTFPHFAAGWAWAMDTPFSGSSRYRRTLEVPPRASSCHGPATLRTWVVSAASFTMSSTSRRRFWKRPAFRSPKRSTASNRSPWRESAWPTHGIRRTPRRRPNTPRNTSRCSEIAASIMTVGWQRPPRRPSRGS